MSELFLGGYLLLAALLVSEALMIRRLVAGAGQNAETLGRRSRAMEEAVNGPQLHTRIPSFRGRGIIPSRQLSEAEITELPSALLFCESFERADFEHLCSSEDIGTSQYVAEKVIVFYAGQQESLQGIEPNRIAVSSVRDVAILHDLDGRIARDFRIRAFPTMVIVGATGHVRAVKSWVKPGSLEVARQRAMGER